MKHKLAIAWITVLIALLCVFGFAACDDAGGNSSNGENSEQQISATEGLTYTLINNGTEYEVSGIGTATDTDIIIRSEYQGLPVTGIGNAAFFGCSELINITIPDGVTRIGNNAFSDCSALTGVTIPNSIISIGEAAFEDCDSLINVEIPDKVTDIAARTFSRCYKLTDVIIGNNVKSIGGCAFESCSALKNITIPNSVTNIGESAFHWCGELVRITFPNSVVSIGDTAFAFCSKLTDVTIGSGVISIGRAAFNGCSSLSNLLVANDNSVYHSVDNCLIETESKTLILGCKNSVIPADGSVINIGQLAFSSCSGLLSITIPSCIINIEDGAFSGSSSLTSVKIPNGISYIDEALFSGCSSLFSILVPNSVIEIKSGAFMECNRLMSVYYCGTAEEWEMIDIDNQNLWNRALFSATIYYYSESDPFEGEGAVTEGNYWHYADDGETIVVWTKETL